MNKCKENSFLNSDLSDLKSSENVEILNEVDLNVVEFEKDNLINFEYENESEDSSDIKMEILCDPLDVNSQNSDDEYIEEYLTENDIDCIVFEEEEEEKEDVQSSEKNLEHLSENEKINYGINFEDLKYSEEKKSPINKFEPDSPPNFEQVFLQNSEANFEPISTQNIEPKLEQNISPHSKSSERNFIQNLEATGEIVRNGERIFVRKEPYGQRIFVRNVEQNGQRNFMRNSEPFVRNGEQVFVRNSEQNLERIYMRYPEPNIERLVVQNPDPNFERVLVNVGPNEPLFVRHPNPNFERENIHAYQHMEEEIHTCDICNKSFRRKSTLYLHKQTHSGRKPYECEICNKTFGFKHNLTKHKRNIHIGMRPYFCEYCSKGFKQKTDLDKHRLLHTGERPYSCIFCYRSFTQNSNLAKHMTIHTGQKLFVCHICGKGFNQRSHLVQHMVTLHYNNNNNVEEPPISEVVWTGHTSDTEYPVIQGNLVERCSYPVQN